MHPARTAFSATRSEEHTSELQSQFHLVFRYEPSETSGDETKPVDDSEEVAEWFETKSDPAVAEAVAAAEAVARTPVDTSLKPDPSLAKGLGLGLGELEPGLPEQSPLPEQQ